ncbi:MAG: hypothetical protein V3S98_02810 [Dehalococcoidia bacterium]
MLVLGFLSSTLGLFPIGNASANTDEVTEETPFSREAVQETADRFSGMYTSVINDIASFASNPDLALAQSRQQEMVSYATTFSDKLNVFADTLQIRLDELTAQLTAPMGLTANAGDGLVALNWDDNPEAELQGYNVYRSTTAGGPYDLLAAVVSISSFVDTGVTNGTTYYYAVTAVSKGSTESSLSSEAAAKPQGSTGA